MGRDISIAKFDSICKNCWKKADGNFDGLDPEDAFSEHSDSDAVSSTEDEGGEELFEEAVSEKLENLLKESDEEL